MSEVGEVPQGSQQPEREAPPQRLEDLPEFQKLAPEQQERLLAIRERLQQEAMNPQQVVSRSINEMGFFEGLYHTVKPHLEKKKTLMVKDLKATASLTLSLIPLVGEGVGIGKGLFGISKVSRIAEAERMAAKAGSVFDTSAAVTRLLVESGKLSDVKYVFEPAVRLAKAGGKIGSEARKTWEAGKKLQAAIKATETTKVLPRIGNTIGRVAEWTSRPLRALWSGGTAPFVSLNRDFNTHALHVADKMLDGNEVHRATQKIHHAAEVKRNLYINKKIQEARAAGHDLENVRWWQLADKWRRFQVQRGGQAEANRVIRRAGRVLDNRLEKHLVDSGKGLMGSKIDVAMQKVKPTILEGLGLKKYLALFDQWFNLTPDVPHWLSTTTAIGEFLGAHGIDAIPAVIQLGQNKFKDIGVTWNMGMDVFKYTRDRLLKPDPARKQAAEVFSPATVATA